MNHYADAWIQEWCQDNGWTDWFKEQYSYWAFPPNAVMPVPIPLEALRSIKTTKGFSPDERLWSFAALFGTAVAAVSTQVLASPMPLVFAFAFCAIIFAQMEVED